MARTADRKQRDLQVPRANVAHYGLTPEQRRALPPFAALKAFEAIGTCGGIRREAGCTHLNHILRPVSSFASLTPQLPTRATGALPL